MYISVQTNVSFCFIKQTYPGKCSVIKISCQLFYYILVYLFGIQFLLIIICILIHSDQYFCCIPVGCYQFARYLSSESRAKCYLGRWLVATIWSLWRLSWRLEAAPGWLSGVCHSVFLGLRCAGYATWCRCLSRSQLWPPRYDLLVCDMSACLQNYRSWWGTELSYNGTMAKV